MHKIKLIIIKLLAYLKIADIKLKFNNRDIVLIYHSVEINASGYSESVSLENFEAHIEILNRHFEFVSLEEMFSGSNYMPRVAITFDDAYDDFYSLAYPIIQKRQIPVTIFVPTSFIESQRYLYENGETSSQKHHLSWEQMRELKSSKLVEFESHAHSHFDSVNNISKLKDDVLISLETIEKELGRRPRYFAYPFGDCNKATHEIVLSCGFEKIFSTQSFPVKAGKVQGRYNIRRSNEDIGLFKLTIAGIKR